MSQLKILQEIVSTLSLAQIETITTYLECFMESGRVSSSKGRKLFEVLISKEASTMTELQIERAVYKTPNEEAFQRLVLRVRDKVLDGMTVHVNVEREDYPEITKVGVQARQRISQAQLLITKGKRKIAESLLTKTISRCKKHEMYDELLLALKILIRQRALHEGATGLDELEELYNNYDFCKRAIFKADLYYHKVVSKVDFHSEPNVRIEWLKSILENIRDEYRLTKSVQHGYFVNYIEAQYFQLIGDYKNARKSFLNIHRLIGRGVVMNTPEILTGVSMNIADNDLYIGRFERAYKTTNDLLDSIKNTFNYDQAIELMYYAKFYNGEYQIATNLIFQLFPEYLPTSEFRKGKRNFLLAAAYFMQSDFQATLRFLKMLNPIESDKDGWNIGVKLLEIMTLIELQENDEAAQKIENLRRLLTPDEVTNHRAKLISGILQTLSYSGYDFKTAYQKENSSIEMLGETSGPLSWKIKSYEMVIFHQWFFAKATRHNFKQVVPSFQIDEPADGKVSAMSES